ncbi:MAG: hypothetical protein JW841_09450 [Deltaproteobacteria bacterium]|nr:hypothetical protein [Deltaproteobacteria bacterium]
MMGKVINFAAMRAKRICRRADKSIPKVTSIHGLIKDKRLAKALAAVAALKDSSFQHKVEIFRHVWQQEK